MHWNHPEGLRGLAKLCHMPLNHLKSRRAPSDSYKFQNVPEIFPRNPHYISKKRVCGTCHNQSLSMFCWYPSASGGDDQWDLRHVLLDEGPHWTAPPRTSDDAGFVDCEVWFRKGWPIAVLIDAGWWWLEHGLLWISIQLGISSSQLTNSYFSEG